MILIFYPILILLFSRIFIFALSPVAHNLVTKFDFVAGEGTWNGVENYFLNQWTAFDSEFYLMISKNGYDLPESTAFFPLYPFLIKILSYIGIQPELSGFLISLISFSIGFIFFSMILKKHFNNDKYPLWLLAFSPISIFFLAVYTESLYLCFTIIAFYFLLDKKWLISSIFAGLASLTRNSGYIIFLCIAIELWNNNPNLSIFIKDIGKKLSWGILISFIYPLYLFIQFNNPIKFITIQTEFWHRHFTLPWVTIYNEILNLLSNQIHYFIVFFNLFYLCIVLWMVFSWRKVRLSFLIFVVLSTLMPLCSPPYWNNIPYTSGLNRYILVLFPIYIFISQKIQNKLLRIIIIEVNMGIMFMFIVAFFGKQFIG